MENSNGVIATRSQKWDRARGFFSRLPKGWSALFFVALAVAAFAVYAVTKSALTFSVTVPRVVLSQLKAGDLIFRVGASWQSDAVRAAHSAERSGDPYSHVGMLVGSPDAWFVLHATPSEAPGRADAVVVDTLDFFLAPERAQGVAIYRVSASESARVAAVSFAKEKVGTPFRIRENDNEGEYCTTLMNSAWKRAGVDLKARYQSLNVPMMRGNYLLPHDLRVSPNLALIFEAMATTPK